VAGKSNKQKMDEVKKIAADEKVKPELPAALPTFQEILNDKDLTFVISQLSTQQRLFADLFINTRDAVGSYMKAFSCTLLSAKANAYRCLNLPYVQMYVNYGWKKGYFQGTMSQAQLVGVMTSVIERCMQVEPICDAEGNSTGQFTFRAQAVISAGRLLKDILGLGEDNKKSDNSNFILRIFCVPAFGNAVVVPEDTKEDITKHIEKEIIERKKK
jgi:hypothetical protein